jgi:hypothetical protein
MTEEDMAPYERATVGAARSMGRRGRALTLLLLTGSLVAMPARGDAVSLRVGERAPEITGEPWINSPSLSLADLRGRVVLVEFWTFG